MLLKRYEKHWLGGLFAFLFFLYACLPFLGGHMFGSPDETATAVIAERVIHSGRASVAEPLAERFPWLHPRSFVSVRETIAPVGFLAWPVFLSLFRLFGAWLLPWVGLLILLSSVWPLYQLLKGFGMRAAWFGVLVAYTTPVMILYGNRSLFPNGAVLAGALWSVWLIRRVSQEKSSWHWYAAIGCVSALMAAIRPVELLWLLPWWIWAGRFLRPSREQWATIGGGALFVLLPLLAFAKATYGSWFGVGYAMRDNAPQTLEAVLPFVSAGSAPVRPWWIPYGFSVRTLIWNGWKFGIGLVWPWVILVLGALWLWIRSTKTSSWREAVRRFTDHPVFFLCVWTGIVLSLIYGGARYLDNINANVATIGNSFLRYFLPLSVVIGCSAAWLVRHVEETKTEWRRFAFIATVLLVLFGVWRGYAADSEGVWTTRRELKRYTAIRVETTRWFQPEDLIVSERSDKVFFPVFRASSPIPPAAELKRFAKQTGLRVGLFARPLSQADRDAWRAFGFTVQERASFGRERLYQLVLVDP